MLLLKIENDSNQVLESFRVCGQNRSQYSRSEQSGTVGGYHRSFGADADKCDIGFHIQCPEDHPKYPHANLALSFENDTYADSVWYVGLIL